MITKVRKTQSALLLSALIFILLASTCAVPVRAVIFDPSVPSTIPKWVNQIGGAPPVYVPTDITDGLGNLIRQEYVVNVTQFTQQILPTTDGLGNPTGFGQTLVWGYGGVAKDAITGAYLGYVRNSPAPTFEAIRNVPVRVTWINNLTDNNGNPLSHMFAVDPTLHWANPNNIDMMTMTPPYPPFPDGFDMAQTPVPIVTHLHGAEVPSAFDGGPNGWFTPNGIHGSGYNTLVPTYPNAAVYEYPNEQEGATLWYHDHALGMTRLNVFSGLAGFYLLRDPDDALEDLLPSGQYEVPLAIQDRNFKSDGSLDFPSVGNNPSTHPYWIPEFFGNTIMVNGLVWPNMDVNQALYRFRVLDGSNARFYNLSFKDTTTNTLLPFTMIGAEGGYLKTSVTLTSQLIAPGERADILVNFTDVPAGHKILLQNDAVTPYPSGDPVDENTAQIMQFTVQGHSGPEQHSLPAALNPTLSGTFPNLPSPIKQRTLTLTEVVNATNDAPLEILLDGQKWSAPISELPAVGTTEDWVIVNPTMDTHPIHLHLVMFQVVSRQTFDAAGYMAEWVGLNGEPPLTSPTVNVPSLTPYLAGSPVAPPLEEQGWKDTVKMNPGEVTIIRVRFTQQDGSPFGFDATSGPGYVWHCHIIDHEDNEMMRPYQLVPAELHVVPEAPFGALMLLGSMLVAFVAFTGFRRLRLTPNGKLQNA
jgi:spore coat protein A